MPPTSNLPLHLQQQQQRQEQLQRQTPAPSSSSRSLQFHPQRRQSGGSTSSSSQIMSMSSSSASALPSTCTFSSRRSHLDERRRQRVLYHLGGVGPQDESSESNADIMMMDPLHITPVGLDPQHKQATATSMSRKFFLTPPERLQVDQSVNLMDVETGTYFDAHQQQYQERSRWFAELPRKSSRTASSPNKTPTGLFSSFLPSSSSPQSSLSALFHGRFNSHSSAGPNHHHHNNNKNNNNNQEEGSRRISFLEAFWDEELGMSEQDKSARKQRSSSTTSSKSKNKTKNKRRKSRNTKSKKRQGGTSGMAFPDNYDPNLWEERAQQAASKRQPLLPQTNNNDNSSSSSSGDETDNDNQTTPRSNTTTDKNHKKRRRNHRRRNDQRRLGRQQSSSSKSRIRRLRPGRVALVCLVLFVVLMAIFLPLLLTGDIAWNKWHSPASSPPPHVPVLVPRNHSYLEVSALPASTQFLMLDNHGHGTPQRSAMQWIQQDPSVTLVTEETDHTYLRGINGNHNNYNNNNTVSVPAELTPMDTLAATQRFALATLYYTTHGPENWEFPHTHPKWMKYNESECEWFGGSQQVHGEYNVCNRYQQLHSMRLRSHNLTGTLPVEELGLLSNLKHIDMGLNNITGSLAPRWFSHYWKNLEQLDISHNHLTGRLPTELGMLTNSNGLRSLLFQYNRFSGPIPSELGNLMGRLRALEVSQNKLTGTIPSQLGGLHSMAVAAAHGGNTTEQPRALNTLRLDGNYFSGMVPSELGLLTQLTVLNLHHNAQLMTQTLPQEICNVQRYYELEHITLDCDIVTCPKDCDCTCMPPLTNSGHHPKLDGAVVSNNNNNNNAATLTNRAAGRKGDNS